MTGQAPDIQSWDLHYGEANSPWEVRQKVRLLAHNGVLLNLFRPDPQMVQSVGKHSCSALPLRC
jgi:hypothetical protein